MTIQNVENADPERRIFSSLKSGFGSIFTGGVDALSGFATNTFDSLSKVGGTVGDILSIDLANRLTDGKFTDYFGSGDQLLSGQSPQFGASQTGASPAPTPAPLWKNPFVIGGGLIAVVGLVLVLRK